MDEHKKSVRKKQAFFAYGSATRMPWILYVQSGISQGIIESGSSFLFVPLTLLKQYNY